MIGELALPDGFVVADVPIPLGGDRHAAGRQAALAVLAPFGATLGHDGTRPVAIGADVAISITHARTRALAIAARAASVGIDLVDDADDERLARIAPRFLPSFATTPEARRACFAAIEAGLKALGLGLLDGGVFERAPVDHCAVRVSSLDPPRLEPDLVLALGRVERATVAVAYRVAGPADGSRGGPSRSPVRGCAEAGP
jgi:hypothetical protein